MHRGKKPHEVLAFRQIIQNRAACYNFTGFHIECKQGYRILIVGEQDFALTLSYGVHHTTLTPSLARSK